MELRINRVQINRSRPVPTSPDNLSPKIPFPTSYPQIPYPLDTLPLEGTWGQRYRTLREEINRHLLKYYLPATTVTGGNYGNHVVEF